VQLLEFGHQHRMIWTIRLTFPNIDKAEALIAVDEERRRPSNVVGGEPEMMIHTITFDHRAIRIDKNGQGKSSGITIIGHFLGALADDHHDLSSKGLICWQMSLQLLQLLAAVRSPGATNEHDHRGFGSQHVGQAKVLPLAGPQLEQRCLISDLQR
jgi:hypothetical protein